MKNKTKILNREKIANGNIISLEKLTVDIDNNLHQWDFITHPGAVAVALYNKEKNKYVMVKQYRIVTDDITLEFCAGKIDKGEELESTLRREVIEETGYTISNIKYFGYIHPSVAFLEEKIHLYKADIESYVGDNQDVGEDIEICEYSLNEIEEFIKNGYISDAKTIALTYHLIKNK